MLLVVRRWYSFMQETFVMRKLHLGRETVSESTGSPLFGKSRADFTNLITSDFRSRTGRKAAVEHGWMQREVDSDEEEE